MQTTIFVYKPYSLVLFARASILPVSLLLISKNIITSSLVRIVLGLVYISIDVTSVRHLELWLGLL